MHLRKVSYVQSCLTSRGVRRHKCLCASRILHNSRIDVYCDREGFIPQPSSFTLAVPKFGVLHRSLHKCVAAAPPIAPFPDRIPATIGTNPEWAVVGHPRPCRINRLTKIRLKSPASFSLIEGRSTTSRRFEVRYGAADQRTFFSGRSFHELPDD